MSITENWRWKVIGFYAETRSAIALSNLSIGTGFSSTTSAPNIDAFSNAPAEVKEAVEKVNACVFKLSGIDKETELDIVEAAPPAEIPATIPNLLPAAINLIQPQSSPILPALVETSQFALSLTARVLKALTDNNYNNITRSLHQRGEASRA